ncbi:MAG: hypothetical protein R3F29_05945 [Planctomycetota bacterium]
MSCSADLRKLASALLGVALGGGAAPAQSPVRLDAVVAAAPQRVGVPAIAWLCERFLPALADWPAGLDPNGTFALTLDAEGVRVHATEVAVPASEVARGALRFGDDGPLLTFACDQKGGEQWFAPTGLQLPASFGKLLRSLDADVFDQPRTVAAPVVAGHLAGGMLAEDPRAVALQLGSALCGDVTWIAWQGADGLRVRGRSDGGLMLPAMLLATAAADGPDNASELLLRAFAGRDGDRAEAVRQLGRDDVEADTATLCAMLSAEDEVRLCAIDALVRRGATECLPEIVASANPERPWSQLAAADAVFELWPDANQDQRDATRRALLHSKSPRMQAIDVEHLDALRAPAPLPLASGDIGARARALMILFVTALGLFGLWARSRLRATFAP